MDTFYTNQEGLSSSLTYFASGDGGATGNFVALQENEKRSITAAPLSLLPSPSLAQQQQQESLGNVPYNRLEHFSNTWGGAGGTYGAEPNLKIITNGVSNGCEWNEQQYEPLSSSWSFLSTYNNPSQQFGQHDNVIQNDTRPMVGISELTVEDFAVFKGHDGDLYSYKPIREESTY
ncbi:hypothetical protein BDB00DRAFT_792345 [Zychaea mexicana]|uniref:uncharacterized protein n=1 Tax=Zychaea mexicana TaxID=64656 RepID=UPI0022FEB769|nr:uncharacterized protein BDB00DRAFT_792345 [Zychaea mexicana]KAI9485084.1 hypothetical protein BDB00DRAFT_792345 [Zychaea mexicana]